jgi:hypothetical protein
VEAICKEDMEYPYLEFMEELVDMVAMEDMVDMVDIQGMEIETMMTDMIMIETMMMAMVIDIETQMNESRENEKSDDKSITIFIINR